MSQGSLLDDDPVRPAQIVSEGLDGAGQAGRPAIVLEPSGPSKAKLAVVGEAGWEDETEPFTSLSGKFFRQLLADAGLPVPKLTFCAATSDLGAQLELLEAEFVILAGDHALQHFRPDLTVRECHGRAFLLDGARLDDSPVLFPVFHHASFLRNNRWRPVLKQEIGVLREIAKRRQTDWLTLVPDTCVRCRGEWWRCDPQGVVYCRDHWGRDGGT